MHCQLYKGAEGHESQRDCRSQGCEDLESSKENHYEREDAQERAREKPCIQVGVEENSER